MKKIFLILVLPTLISGCQKKVRSSDAVAHPSSTITMSGSGPNTPEREEDSLLRTYIEDPGRYDSLMFAYALEEALKIADENKQKGSFHYTNDSSYGMQTRMVFGHLFSASRKHLVLQRKVDWGAICSVFLLEKGAFQPVLEREQFGNSFVNDTVRDVNGDGFKDFLVHWYPSAGCCRRDIYTVYLYEPQSGGFSAEYEFMNPTFFPREKIIRGVDYGHPGTVALYKYKWNDKQVDTLEFVYPDTSRKGHFFVGRDVHWGPPFPPRPVKGLPKEYRSIESLDWFLRYL